MNQPASLRKAHKKKINKGNMGWYLNPILLTKAKGATVDLPLDKM